MANRYLHVKLIDQVAVRPFAPADALGVVDLLYKTYGYTYRGAEHVYDPDAAAAHFARPGAAALVATDASGRILGFVAFSPLGPDEAEIDGLAVDPGDRRGEVAKRLAAAMFELASRRARKVVTSLVTRHAHAQRAVIPVGFRPLALEVGAHPPDLAFRALERPGEARPRETFLYGGWFFGEPAGPDARRTRPIYLPPRHAAIVREILAQAGIEREPQDPARGPASEAASEIEVDLRESWLSAQLDVARPGRDLVERIEALKRDLDDGFVEHVELRLPLDHPAAATADLDRIEALGFFFSGIDPGLAGGDRLRLTALARPLDFARLRIEPSAQSLARYVEACAPAAVRVTAVPARGEPAPSGDAVRRLSAGLAHEINNPLNIILGSTYYLKQRLRDGKAVEADEQIRSIEVEVSRIAKLLENLERYANPERPAALPLDPERPLASALALVEGLAKARGVALARRFAGGLGPVRGDPAQLEQVFVQVALNAIDASPAGAEVTVETRRDGPWALVLVRDRGRGIAAEDLPHVFEPFFTKKEPGQGTGLGLSIARALAQAHGGEVEVESRDGDGTLARVRLPVAADAPRNGEAAPRAAIVTVKG
jgi:signal transduction histidine kinase/ribosomal protein S18 acetylase RimI-like enzyme